MPVRFDATRKITGALFAALLVVALVVPACMTLACRDASMLGDGMMGGVSIAECLDTAAPHDGLVAAGGSMRIAAGSPVAVFGAGLATEFSAPSTAVGWVLKSNAVGPLPPLNPRGVRLLV